MTNISPLQQQWQQELSLIQDNKNAAFNQDQAYAEKLAALEDKLASAHGLSRLKKPFVKATKIAWLHHKQKKIAKHLAKEERQLTQTAAKIFATLGATVTADSAYAPKFSELKNIIYQIQNVQNVVDNAASQCSYASSTETMTAFNDNNKGMDFMANMNTTSAVNAVRNAEQAVINLQKTLQKEMPQVNGGIAGNIAQSNNWAFMMDMFGGFMGTFSNLNVANQLSNAEYHMRDVSNQLGSAINNFARERDTLVKSALTEARQKDSELEKFAATLENYMLPAALRKSSSLTKKNSGLIKK